LAGATGNLVMTVKNHVFSVMQQELKFTADCQNVVMLVLFVVPLTLCAQAGDLLYENPKRVVAQKPTYWG